MKKILIILSFFYTTAFSHSLLINLLDNEDNTITVEGVYSTGERATGAMVRIESLLTGEILYKKRLPVESEITTQIPKEPYQIVLDGGPGHIFIKKGVPPLEGFPKKLENDIKEEKKNTLSVAVNKTYEWSITTIFLFTCCLILLILAIYFSFKNTNRILEKIEEIKDQ